MDQRPYRFMEPVITPQGEGFFIGYLSHPVKITSCQVAIRERGIQRNPIFRLESITRPSDTKKVRQQHQDGYTQPDFSQVSETAARMPVTTRDIT